MAVVGETLTMTPGTFSGGTDAKTQDDHLEVSADGQGGWSWFKQALTHELTADDDGKYFRAYSLCMEDGLDSVNGASAPIGPVTRPVLPEFDVWVNGELHEDPSADVGVAPGGQVMLEVRPQPSNTAATDVAYKWAVRTGTGRLSGDENSRGIVYIAPEEPPAGALVTCTATSADADDSAYAAEVTILVSE